MDIFETLPFSLKNVVAVAYIIQATDRRIACSRTVILIKQVVGSDLEN
jgi:hypothetical protein